MERTPLYTTHLMIRRFDLTDAAFVLELLNTPSWLRFIGDKHVHTLADAEQYIVKGAFYSFETHGYGPYVVVQQDTHKAIGVCGLYKRPHLAHPDLGFAFLPGAEGKGYAFESCMAVMQHVFTTKGINKLFALTDPENTRSIALLARCGFSREGLTTYHEMPSILFSRAMMG